MINTSIIDIDKEAQRMKECIFHFQLIKGAKSKDLRALILLSADKKPGITDFIHAFRELGYTVELENERKLIFHSLTGKEPYKLDITKIEIAGEQEETPVHDGELSTILENVIHHDW
jgi:hypothetical protein